MTPKIDRYLLRFPDADIQVTHLMNKDSLEMTGTYRAQVLETVREKRSTTTEPTLFWVAKL